MITLSNVSMPKGTIPQHNIATGIVLANPRDQLMEKLPSSPTQNPPEPPALNPCPHCGAPAHITEMTHGKYMIECSNRIDCAKWPLTACHQGLEAASQAWNSGFTI